MNYKGAGATPNAGAEVTSSYLYGEKTGNIGGTAKSVSNQPFALVSDVFPVIELIGSFEAPKAKTSTFQKLVSKISFKSKDGPCSNQLYYYPFNGGFQWCDLSS